MTKHTPAPWVSMVNEATITELFCHACQSGDLPVVRALANSKTYKRIIAFNLKKLDPIQYKANLLVPTKRNRFYIQKQVKKVLNLLKDDNND